MIVLIAWKHCISGLNFIHCCFDTLSRMVGTFNFHWGWIILWLLLQKYVSDNDNCSDYNESSHTHNDTNDYFVGF